jgi:hypothetical protein
MSFFEPPPPPPEPPEPARQPEWLNPPTNVLGVALPWRLILARSESVAVLVDGATAYPTGIALRVAALSRPTDSLHDDPFDFPFGHPATRYRGHGTGELPPELLRIGVELADGRKATTLDPHPFGLGEDADPEGPLLTQGGGGGGGGSWRFDFWLWPLPPPGPLTFACEWPAKGIELTRVEVDASAAIEAAARAEVLWPEEGDGPGGWTTSQFSSG